MQLNKPNEVMQRVPQSLLNMKFPESKKRDRNEAMGDQHQRAGFTSNNRQPDHCGQGMQPDAAMDSESNSFRQFDQQQQLFSQLSLNSSGNNLQNNQNIEWTG